MAIATGNAVKMVYVNGSELPASPNEDTVYFVAGSGKLYVGSQIIADLALPTLTSEVTRLEGLIDAVEAGGVVIEVTGSGSDVVDAAYDSSTKTLTITKGDLSAKYATVARMNAAESAITDIQGDIADLGDTYATDAELAAVEAKADQNTTDIATLNTNKLDKNGDASQLTTGTPATDTAIANKKYVDDAVAGLSGAMHFKGVSTSAITDGGTEQATIGGQALTAQAGDVVLYGAREFVWTGSAWEELGDEGSFALKTTQVIAGTGLTGGGALSGDVTISHGAVGTTTASDVTADDATAINVMSGVDIDGFGHVGSINEKNIYNAVKTVADASAEAVKLTWTVA